MTKITLTDAQVETLLEYGPGEFDYELRSYSGRGMYGRECLGIITDEPSKIVYAIGCAIGYLETSGASEDTIGFDLYDALEAFQTSHTDDMGQFAILYFPDVTLTE